MEPLRCSPAADDQRYPHQLRRGLIRDVVAILAGHERPALPGGLATMCRHTVVAILASRGRLALLDSQKGWRHPVSGLRSSLTADG